MSMGDRKRGALIGLAVGDALGQAVEFKSPGSFAEVTGYRGGGPFGLSPGEWTDDTSMALALGHSVTETGWDLDDQMKRYLSWYEDGKYSVNGQCFDIGTTTSQALRAYKRGGDVRNSAASSSRSSGNGSIMRLAPVPIAFAGLFSDDLDTLVERLVESSLTTHASPQCLHATAYFGLVLAGLIHGLPRDEVLDPSWPPLGRLGELHEMHFEVQEVTQGSYRYRQPPEIRGSGYVVRSLEAALWAFHDADDFAQAVLRAVNLGDDADTTGAICGQLAGACWGESGIRDEWREGLARRDLIEPILERLLTC